MHTELIDAVDDDYLWMLNGPPRLPHLRLAPGGIDEPFVLNIVRGVAKRLRASHDRGAWMMVSDGEVVGLCNYMAAPNADGAVEIGYGVAASRRGLGHATRAVAAMLDVARADPAVQTVTALTSVDNPASQQCLRRNGFIEGGRHVDPEDGEVIRWRRGLD